MGQWGEAQLAIGQAAADRANPLYFRASLYLDRFFSALDGKRIIVVPGGGGMEDWDNDGDLDLYVFQKLTNENQYFSNELNSKNYLKITPRGTVANRMLFDNETDKETYIEEYKVETVLKFMKKFDL